MADLSKKIEELISNSTQSNWKRNVEWRRENMDWLEKSSDIAFRILDALDSVGWNKTRLAKEMGVSRQQISKYVKGEENFKIETICKLEKVLGVELVTIVHEDEEVVRKGTWKYVETIPQVANIEVSKGGFWSYLSKSTKVKEFSYAEAA